MFRRFISGYLGASALFGVGWTGYESYEETNGYNSLLDRSNAIIVGIVSGAVHGPVMLPLWAIDKYLKK